MGGSQALTKPGSGQSQPSVTAVPSTAIREQRGRLGGAQAERGTRHNARGDSTARPPGTQHTAHSTQHTQHTEHTEHTHCPRIAAGSSHAPTPRRSAAAPQPAQPGLIPQPNPSCSNQNGLCWCLFLSQQTDSSSALNTRELKQGVGFSCYPTLYPVLQGEHAVLPTRWKCLFRLILLVFYSQIAHRLVFLICNRSKFHALFVYFALPFVLYSH